MRVFRRDDDRYLRAASSGFLERLEAYLGHCPLFDVSHGVETRPGGVRLRANPACRSKIFYDRG